MRSMRARRGSGFTLVELLVVIAIIGVLVALLLPAVQAAREAARRSDCSNKAKQLALASHNFHDTYGRYPAANIRGANQNTSSQYGQMTYNFLFAILPYMEQQAVFDAGFASAVSWNTNAGLAGQTHASWDAPIASGSPSGTIRALVLKGFNCPSDYTLSNGYAANQVNAWGGSSYAGNFQLLGMNGIVPQNCQGTCRMAKYGLANEPDGSSNTVLLAERLAACGNSGGDRGNLWAWPGGDWNPNEWGVTFANSPWGGNWNQPPIVKPVPFLGALGKCDRTRPASGHTAVCIVAMADASVRGVSATVSQVTWLQAITPDDGIPLGSNW